MELKKLERMVATFLAVAGISLAPAVAVAHPMLEAASPRVGASVSVAPHEISLSFSEQVQASISKISLTTDEGLKVGLSEVESGVSYRILIAKVLTPLAPGRYQVNWSVVSADGHSAIGDFKFTVTR